MLPSKSLFRQITIELASGFLAVSGVAMFLAAMLGPALYGTFEHPGKFATIAILVYYAALICWFVGWSIGPRSE